MTLEETKQLLRTYRITPNKLLGQNFMVEPAFYPKLCNYASLNDSDVVLDAGAGFGFLARFMAAKCKTVIAVEKDPQIANALREQLENVSNVDIIEGNVLKVKLPAFNKVIAIPPYYLSSNLITWLIESTIACSVLILQKEFAQRLIAPIGSEDYSWLTVVTYQKAEVDLFDKVSKASFYPQPEVDSVIVHLKPWSKTPFKVNDSSFFRRMVKWLFTQRNKKLNNALAPFAKNEFKIDKIEAKRIVDNLPFQDKRVRDLSPEDFGAIANALSR